MFSDKIILNLPMEEKKKKKEKNLGYGYHSMEIELPKHEPAHEIAFLFAIGWVYVDATNPKPLEVVYTKVWSWSSFWSKVVGVGCWSISVSCGWHSSHDQLLVLQQSICQTIIFANPIELYRVSTWKNNHIIAWLLVVQIDSEEHYKMLVPLYVPLQAHL